MYKTLSPVAAFLSVFIVAPGIALSASIPLSSCTAKAGPSFTCNLYPSDSSGNLSDIMNISFPAGYSQATDPVTAGYLVLVKAGSNISSGEDSNLNDYDQVLSFNDNGLGFATGLTLYTRGCNNPSNPNDVSCFPAFSKITASSDFFDFEPASNVYLYQAGDVRDHEYTLHFIAETPAAGVPEPASVLLMAGSLLCLGCYRGLRQFTRYRAFGTSFRH